MSSAVRAEALGKRFFIGSSAQGADSLAGALAAGAVRRLKRAGRLIKPLDDAVKRAGEEFWALRDVSFSVEHGDVFAIIGPNGSGKSTLLKILARITPPTEGTAAIAGRVGSLLEVGTGFHGELTGRENVYLSGTILGMKQVEISQRFDEIVEFSGVEKFIDTPVKHYSSGMYLRLAFAVAAHLRTEILLIDEVLAVGDAAFQRKCLDKMSTVAKDGRTVLFVSHNLAAVSRLCRSGLVLQGGKIVSLGTAATAVSAYEALSAGGATAEGHESAHGAAIVISRFLLESPPGELTPGTPLRFRLELHVLRPFWSLSVVFGLRTADQEGLVLDVLDSERAPQLTTPGHYSVRISLPPLWLRPRVYTAQTKAIGHRSDGKTERFVSDCLDVAILSDGTEGLSDRWLQPRIEWEAAPCRPEPAVPDAPVPEER